MKLFSEICFIARIEAHLYLRHPKYILAMLAVALIPALYVLIYLSSVWDPAANTGSLAVALVNLDRSVDYRGNVFNVGNELIAKLKDSHRFGYRDFKDAEEARRLVRQGKLAFALIIPPDFSSNAIPGAKAGAGKLEIYVSEGNSYQSATLARHYSESLGHEVNESLNEQRWQLVLSNALGSQQGIERLRDAVSQARKGGRDLAVATGQAAVGTAALHSGVVQLHQGVGQLAVGVKGLGAGLRTLDEKQPPAAELARLRQGAEALVSAQGELGRGLGELRTGTQRLQEGVSVFHEEAKDSILVSERVTDSLDRLSEGLSGLDSGLQSALAAHGKLAQGAEQLSTGVSALTTGVGTMSSGIHAMSAKLAADTQVDKLLAGSGKLESGTAELMDAANKIGAGAQHLSGGLDLLANALPAADVQALEGSAKGLAKSVLPGVEVAAPVRNNGISFAPNIIPAALWLGAGIAAFLIYVRQQPNEALDFSRPAKLLGKIMLPAFVVLVQAFLVMLSVLFLLGIEVAHRLPFALTLAVASLTFVIIVFALTRAFGDAGKALALLFLAVQLSSSGGILPVELSGPVFTDISPWLPLTWVVRAIKASMFDAYDGAWHAPLLYVSLAGLLAAVMACRVGRWYYVDAANLRPALDI
ncbi:MAG: hypothetical protein H6R18_873 [Proteobacteria bacterium]|nr:hypothetical protein [Pseudomonadota bacterium]